MTTEKLQKRFDSTILSSNIHDTIDTPMLMASITKLLTTTCILAMVQEEKLSLENKISRYLSDEIIKDLHVYKGQEYSFELTIHNLLLQTSGLPDFYLDGNVFSKVTQSDFGFSFREELTSVKSMKPRFMPIYKSKAYYSDINFDLLGKMIEAVLGCTLQQAYDQYIFYPLRYAGGFMTVNASTPFGKAVKLIGHNGSTGSFAFYAPEKDLFFVGDLAQMACPAAGVRLAMQAALSIE